MRLAFVEPRQGDGRVASEFADERARPPDEAYSTNLLLQIYRSVFTLLVLSESVPFSRVSLFVDSQLRIEAFGGSSSS